MSRKIATWLSCPSGASYLMVSSTWPPVNSFVSGDCASLISMRPLLLLVCQTLSASLRRKTWPAKTLSMTSSTNASNRTSDMEVLAARVAEGSPTMDFFRARRSLFRWTATWLTLEKYRRWSIVSESVRPHVSKVRSKFPWKTSSCVSERSSAASMTPWRGVRSSWDKEPSTSDCALFTSRASSLWVSDIASMPKALR